MRVTILQQPFDGNGALSRLGVTFIAQLAHVHFNQVQILSAFVTSSGTQRLRAALTAVTSRGGHATALIGVNNGLTSMQAVADLHAAGVEVLGFHTGGSVLYHPKVYLLRGADRAWLSVGSSNLTGDGMYRNFETNSLIELDLGQTDDLHFLDETLAWIAHFRGTYQHNTIPITPNAIPDLVADGTLVDEIAKAREKRATRGDRTRRGRRQNTPPPIPVPSLPAVIEPIVGPAAARRRRVVRVPAAASVANPNPQTRYFAMVLSAHDASKKTGRPGTPELSLPRAARDFFPRMSVAQHEYPDAYFDVRLNGQQSSTVM